MRCDLTVNINVAFINCLLWALFITKCQFAKLKVINTDLITFVVKVIVAQLRLK
jgi:hypothetical protein